MASKLKELETGTKNMHDLIATKDKEIARVTKEN